MTFGNIEYLEEYKEKIEKIGFEVIIPVGGERLTFPGQVLGCNYSGDRDDIGHYLFLGSGDFSSASLTIFSA